jgi:AraC-like DNA-binding protein
VDIQRLRGYGWAVGVLFRPCAARVLLADVPGPRGARADTVLPAAGTPLRDAPGDDVAALHDAGLSPEGVLRAWLAPFAEHVDERDRLVNEACRIAGEDASVDRAGELAARLAVAPRTLERLTKHYLGLSPKWLIECRRLQQAATTLFAAPGTDLSELAARLDYTDYAHFSRRYRAVLGESPDATRRAGADAARRRVLRPRER